MNDYVFEFAIVDNFEKHSAFVLVEPFGCFVDMVIGSSVRSSYDLGFVGLALRFVNWRVRDTYHDGHIFVVNAIVIDWWFEEVGVLL